MSHSAFLVRVTNLMVSEHGDEHPIISINLLGKVSQVQVGDSSRRGWLLLCQAKLPRPLQPRVQWRLYSEVKITLQHSPKTLTILTKLAINFRKEARRNGLGEKMGAAFLPLARDLGYSASFFNLVFVSNDVR